MSYFTIKWIFFFSMYHLVTIYRKYPEQEISILNLRQVLQIEYQALIQILTIQNLRCENARMH